MLFDDNDSVISEILGMVGVNESRHCVTSLDVETIRHFNTSPPTIVPDMLDFDANAEDEFEDDNMQLDEEVREGVTHENKKLLAASKLQPITFLLVPPESYEVKIERSSLLTQSICKKVSGPSSVGIRTGGVNIPLIFYLPKAGQSLTIEVREDALVEDVIKLVLFNHKARMIQPPLLYDAAVDRYELRLHEGDGEPDMDFKALERGKRLRQYGKLNEYCLRETNVRASVALSSVPSNDNITSQSVDVQGSGKSLGTPVVGEGKATISGTLPVNTVMVSLPNAGHVKLRVEETTTVRDLLPLIANKHRLRLYTDEYEFVMPNKDQIRLRLMSPVVDGNVPILALGVKEFVLQRRIYADTVKKGSAGWGGGKADNRNSSKTTSSTTVSHGNNVYQEWAVIEKDIHGRRQKRVLGMDAQKMYTYKRDLDLSLIRDLSPARPVDNGRLLPLAAQQRFISSIVKISVVEGDDLTFRIAWSDLKEICEMEYTCNSPRECSEIVARTRHLLKS
eukprot:gene1891-3666_t